MKVAVLGGGHGCYAAAADLAEAGHEVRLWRRDGAALAPVVEAGGIVLVDERGRREVAIAMATADLGAALAGAELIVVPSPAIAQADIARAMAPHLQNGQVVFLPPGTFGSFVMARIVARAGLAGRGRLGGDRDPALPGEEARGARGAGDDPGGAPADRRLSGAAGGGSAGGDRARLSVGAWLRRCLVGGADERRAGDPSAADGDERGAAAALRSLGHPCRRHAAGGARRHRPARPRADRGARGARLRRAALSARRPLRQRPLDVRRRAQEARRLGRLARAHRPAHASLRHRGHRARPRLPRLGGALVRRRCADRARPARGDRRLPRPRPAPRPAHARGARPRRARPRRRCSSGCTTANSGQTTSRWHATPPSAPAAWAAASPSPSPTPATPSP